jgi:hypothetical protein
MKETTHDNGFLYGKETFKFDQFVLVGDHRTLMGLTGLINNASFSRLKNYPIYLLFLKLNFTLAKWFYGKKSAL